MNILLVDDDESFRDLAEYHLTMNPDHKVNMVGSGREYEKTINAQTHVVCIDFFLPDTTGDKLLAWTKENYPKVDVIMISGQDDINQAIDLLRKGAFDYVTKDENAFKKLWSVLNNLKERTNLKEEVQTLKKRLSQVAIQDSPIIGEDPKLDAMNQLIERAAGSHINVLVHGETGTGKELVASTIHNHSDRKKKPLVAINVAAIPPNLLESELFGHKKGAFTGASSDRKGKFEEADGSTLFLDEIAEMELPMQAKILRVLQESEVTRIGDNKPRKIDFRLIAASHKDLKTLVEKGTFREDLFYRILGLRIEIPALRDRGTDTILIAEHFIAQFAKNYDQAIKKLSKDAKKKLMMHPFRGNIRELKSVIDLAMVMTDGGTIKADNIQLETVRISEMEASLTQDEKTMKEYELFILKHFLDKYDFDVKKVADILDIGRSSIYRTISQNKLNKGE